MQSQVSEDAAKIALKLSYYILIYVYMYIKVFTNDILLARMLLTLSGGIYS